MRVFELVVMAALAATGTLPAFASEIHQFNIPEEEAAVAIRDFGTQAHMQILVAGEAVSGKKLHAVTGELSTEDGLNTLLTGSGLTHEYVGDHSVAIMPARMLSTGSSTQASEAPAGTDSAEKEGKKSSSGGFRSDQVDQGGNSQATSVGAATGSQESTGKFELQEIVVTAQKRAERSIDVPVSVTAISGQTLLDSNQVRLQDYYSTVPGLSVTSQGFRDAPVLAIRGIVTGTGSNPTVGIVVDDVPYGASTNLGGGTLAPDFDPGDLDHLEVLRGPQGTLYGAASMGGLIKYVTRTPSTETFSGRVEAGTSDVYKGATPGYNVRGSVNVPLSYTLAMRVSGFSRQDPGYIDDPKLAINGVNEAWAYGGRFSGLWKPSDTFSVKLSALLQQSKANGSPLAFPSLGDLQQSDARGTGWSDKRLQAYSATLAAKLGAADLTAISGYNVNTFSDVIDFTQLLGGYVQFTPFAAVSGWSIPEQNKTSKFTQEVRLSVPITGSINWLLGAFYDHESSSYRQENLALDPQTGVAAGELGTNSFPSTFTEYAGFTDVTIRISDPFDVQIGARESQIRQTYSETIAGSAYTELFYGLPSPIVQPRESANANSFTYLVTPRLKVSPDLTVYARLASGYRPGAINLGNSIFNLPLISKPDETQSYEVGVKGDVLEHAMSFDVSLYHIDWKDIQLTILDPRTGDSVYVNGSRAKSQGIELSVASRPMQGLTVAAWTAWNDAQLTEPIPPGGVGSVIGVAGDRLPYSSRFSGNLSLEQEFPIWGRTGFVGGAVSYVGNREGEFTSSPLRQNLSGFATTTLRAGFRSDSWACNLFVDNAFDRRGVLSGGLGTYISNAFTYTRPRTIGLNVSKEL